MSEVKFLKLLNMALEGHPKEFELISNLIQDKNTSQDILIFLLKQIDAKESLKSKACLLLLKFMDSFNYKREDIFNLHKNILLNVALSNQAIIAPLLEKIQFILTNLGCNKEKLEETCDQAESNNEQLYTLLQEIIDMFSTSAPLLIDHTARNYHHYTRDKDTHLAYLQFVLRVYTMLKNTSYDTYLMDTCVSYVLNIEISLIPLNQTTHQNSNDFFRDELFNNLGDRYNSGESPKKLYSNTSSGFADSCVKMDAIMIEFLDYIKISTQTDGSGSQFARHLFQDLITAFDNHLLVKRGMHHTHLLIFYLCHLMSAFAENFVDHCWKSFINPSLQSHVRHNALNYMTSYLARAKYLHIRTLMASFEAMSCWANNFMSQVDMPTTLITNGRKEVPDYETALDHDLERYLDFYRVCQAMFYIFCLKHPKIMSYPEAKDIVCKLNWERLLFSRLNPMRFSNPLLNSRFASLCRQYNILYCTTIIEHNNRMLLNNVATTPNKTCLGSYYSFERIPLTETFEFIKHLLYYPVGHEGIIRESLSSENHQFLSLRQNTVPPPFTSSSLNPAHLEPDLSPVDLECDDKYEETILGLSPPDQPKSHYLLSELTLNHSFESFPLKK